jgi:hypothetical protein
MVASFEGLWWSLHTIAKIVRVDRLAFVSAMVRRRQPGNRENVAAAAWESLVFTSVDHNYLCVEPQLLSSRHVRWELTGSSHAGLFKRDGILTFLAFLRDCLNKLSTCWSTFLLNSTLHSTCDETKFKPGIRSPLSPALLRRYHFLFFRTNISQYCAEWRSRTHLFFLTLTEFICEINFLTEKNRHKKVAAVFQWEHFFQLFYDSFTNSAEKVSVEALANCCTNKYWHTVYVQ